MIRVPTPPRIMKQQSMMLDARPAGIDTYQEPVVYMRGDCPICRSEGFESQSRVQLRGNNRSFVATLNTVNADWLEHGQAGLSEIAWQMLGADRPCPVTFSHPEPVDSFSQVRAKLFGHSLAATDLAAIIGDIAHRRYSDVQLSAFLSACIGDRMSNDEVVSLTRAMVQAGDRLAWGRPVVFDKHCVGGLPGNRTTPIVVAIVTACGLTMPKTSSRAITSPAGTADTMETLTKVSLSLDEMRNVVEQEGGCLIWGGSVALSPADDVLIRIERALDVDSEAQLVASVLSKKIAAGATHAIIDIPVGSTAKVRDRSAAAQLSTTLQYTSSKLGLALDIVLTDGSQPVGRGIGPALEARDVLDVLQLNENAPEDLRTRAMVLAGRILEFSGLAETGHGMAQALKILNSGQAWNKFQRICRAQGGLREPPVSTHKQTVVADRTGTICDIDNRRLAKVAKLAGAPIAPAAGVDLHVHLGDVVESGSPLLTVHADAPGELAYALEYLGRHADLIRTKGPGKSKA